MHLGVFIIVWQAQNEHIALKNIYRVYKFW